MPSTGDKILYMLMQYGMFYGGWSLLIKYCSVVWRSAVWCQYISPSSYEANSCVSISKPHKTCNIVWTCLEFGLQQRDQAPLMITKYYTCIWHVLTFMGVWSSLIKYGPILSNFVKYEIFQNPIKPAILYGHAWKLVTSRRD